MSAPEMLWQLMYRSRTATPTADGQPPAFLPTVLDAARRRNAEAGISGALLYDGTCFVQVLEAELPAIEQVFESISRDLRHRDVVLIDFSPIERRAFAGWDMAYVDRAALGEPFNGGGADGSHFAEDAKSADIHDALRAAVPARA